jgi:hypothetical protein
MLRGSAGPRHGAANPGLNASTSREINAAFATFVRERPDALFVGLDPFLNSRRAQLVNLASRHDSCSVSDGSRVQNAAGHSPG